MRIAFLSPFYPYRGGIAQPSALLYRELEKEHQVEAFTFTRQYPNILFPGSNQYVTTNDNADVIPAVRCLDTINPVTYFTAAKKIKTFKPDLFLSAFWMPFFAPSYGTVSKLLKKKTKIISILHNVIPHEKRFGDISLLKYFLRNNHGFVVMSDSVRNDLLTIMPDAKYIFHELPLYSHFLPKVESLSAKRALCIPENKKIILFFGFIRDYKGLDLLIEAMRGLDESYVLVIAGEVYGSFDKYEKQINHLNISNRVLKFIRYINDVEVPLFFSSADVCVLPYKSATQSGITSISFHYDLPIIATDTGGLKEIIQINETGLIVEKPDGNHIAEAIRKYFDKNLRNKFIPNIIRLKEKLSWKNYAEALLNFYHSL
jgi:glycosyltransferase involved in cell wall biosynthesis